MVIKKATRELEPAEHKRYAVYNCKIDNEVIEFDEIEEAIAYILTNTDTTSVAIKRCGTTIWR
jgi:hypothetical protein